MKSSTKAIRQIVSLKSKSSGQAIIELLISLAVLIVFVISLVTVVNYSLSAIGFSRNKSNSLQYAQEAIELAREQRALDWNVLSTPSSWPTNPNGTITGTPFTRTVVVTDIAANEKQIVVTISWISNGRSHQTILTTVLTNWQ